MTVSFTENLIQTGLVEARSVNEGEDIYILHPGVAEIGRKNAGTEFMAKVDDAMRGLWWSALGNLLVKEVEQTDALIDFAQRGAPYLIRRQRWEEATGMLEQIVLRFPSPVILDQMIPLLRRIAEASKDTAKGIESAGVLAMALMNSGQIDEAEKLQRQIIEKAVATENYRIAVSTAADLCYLLEQSGRLREALEVAEQLPEYRRLGNFDIWVELMNERMRLQVLSDIDFSDSGLFSQLLDLYRRMENTPDDEGKAGMVRPYHEREMTLVLMASIAVRKRQWEAAIDLFMKIIASKQRRGAPVLEVAPGLVSIAEALIELKRFDEAKKILFECKPIFEEARALGELSVIFDALAGLEWQLEHWKQANAHQETALRYSYLITVPRRISIAHFNLARSLNRVQPESPNAIAHRLAACIIDLQTHSGELTESLDQLVSDIGNFSPSAASLPRSFDELCELVEQTEGVRFRELFDELPAEYSGDEALLAVLTMVQTKLESLDA